MNRFLYGVLYVLTRVILAPLLGVRLYRDEQVKALQGPMVVLSNHSNWLDPLFVGLAVSHRPLRFVAGDFMFTKGLIGRFVRALGVISKTQFRPDPASIRNIMAAIKSGEAVAFFPEGQRSLNGALWPLQPGLGKLLKKLKAPVVAVTIQGAYLTWPRWSMSWLRPGRIRVSSALLLKPEELSRLSPEEIEKKVREQINADDYRWQKSQPRPKRFFSFAPAKGLDNVCHRCPSCGRPVAMRSLRAALVCEHCGYRADLSLSGNFKNGRFADPQKWTAWQTGCLSFDRLPLPFRLRCRAKSGRAGEKEQSAGEGVITFSGAELVWEPEAEGSSKVRTERFAVPEQGLKASYGRYFNLFQPAASREGADRLWTFYPEDGRSVMYLKDLIDRFRSSFAAEAARDLKAPALSLRPVHKRI